MQYEKVSPVPDTSSLEQPECASQPLLEVRNLQKTFPIGNRFNRKYVKAIQDVSFSMNTGEVLGLVGESGSGKTTVGRCIVRLIEPTSGDVFFQGQNLATASKQELRSLRKPLQIIFQDPFGALNPRMKVGAIISEGMKIHNIAHGEQARERAKELLKKVGLSENHIDRYPHEFSGGQRQRIGIARVLAVDAKFIIADEPVSALDVSIQAQVINLLQDLKEEYGLSMLCISHDLGVVEHISDRVAVMYLGRLMEIGTKEDIYDNPRHPYTQSLLDAMPVPDPERPRKDENILQGDIPSPISPPSGCVFRTRCPIATKECAEVVPPLEEVSSGHLKACIRQ
ncbi:ABC transporter ATP-binding protein [Halomonas sp. BC04]|uniref:ABC transporter ATP-binding protein n=1 Tax=Halomonas sp. BC04 TaxID=1403540 RepID=UPI0003ED78FC|nr:ABC transporter ATP-binding protein [Halomonas sp. BC04]EWG97754.1 peptide ABC transporter ATP-binding protein [Halomonas sp. BC04]